MKFFAAGSYTRKYLKFCNKHNCHKLWSIIREKTEFLKWHADRWTMLDSGAHSWNKLVTSHIQSVNLPPIEDHTEFWTKFVNECDKPEAVFVELDVFKIYDIAKLDDIYSKFTNPQVMRVYHPELDNHTIDIVKKWIYDDGHKYIGVANESTHLLDAIFNLTRDKIMVHGFANDEAGSP